MQKYKILKPRSQQSISNPIYGTLKWRGEFSYFPPESAPSEPCKHTNIFIYRIPLFYWQGRLWKAQIKDSRSRKYAGDTARFRACIFARKSAIRSTFLCRGNFRYFHILVEVIRLSSVIWYFRDIVGFLNNSTALFSYWKTDEGALNAL